MKYQVEITARIVQTIDVIADNRYKALEKAQETLQYAEPSTYKTKLEKVEHVVLTEANGYEWMVRQTPGSTVWRMTAQGLNHDYQEIPSEWNNTAGSGSGDDISPQE